MQFEKWAIDLYWPKLHFRFQDWLPTPGNVIFTLLVIGSLLWAHQPSTHR